MFGVQEANQRSEATMTSLGQQQKQERYMTYNTDPSDWCNSDGADYDYDDDVSSPRSASNTSSDECQQAAAASSRPIAPSAHHRRQRKRDPDADANSASSTSANNRWDRCKSSFRSKTPTMPHQHMVRLRFFMKFLSR